MKKQLKMAQKLIETGQLYWGIEILDAVLEEFQGIKKSNEEETFLLSQICEMWESCLQIYEEDLRGNWPELVLIYDSLLGLYSDLGHYQKIYTTGLELMRKLTLQGMATTVQHVSLLENIISILLSAGDEEVALALKLIFTAVLFENSFKSRIEFRYLLTQFDLLLQKLDPAQGRYLLYSVFHQSLAEVYLKYYFTPYKEYLDTNEMSQEKGEGPTLLNYSRQLYRLLSDHVGITMRDCLTQVNLLIKEGFSIGEHLNEIEQLIKQLSLLGEDLWSFVCLELITTQYYVDQDLDTLELKARLYMNLFLSYNCFNNAYRGLLLFSRLLQQRFGEYGLNLMLPLWKHLSLKIRDQNHASILISTLSSLNQFITVPQSEEEIESFLELQNHLYRLQIGYILPQQETLLYALLYRAIYQVKRPRAAQFLLDLIVQLQSQRKQAVGSTAKFSLGTQMEETSQETGEFYFPNLQGTSFLQNVQIIVSNIPETEMPTSSLSHVEFNRVLIILEENKNALIKTVLKQPDSPSMGTLLRTDDQLEFQVIVENRNLFGDKFEELLLLAAPQQVQILVNYLHQTTITDTPQEILTLACHKNFIPWELFGDQNGKFLQRYAFGYSVGNSQMQGLKLEKSVSTGEILTDISVGVIGALNEKAPLFWQRGSEENVPVLALPMFSQVVRGLLVNFKESFPGNFHLNSFTQMTGEYEKIHEFIPNNPLAILHFTSYLFYNPTQPLDSYFLTADERVLKLHEIAELLEENRENLAAGQQIHKPLLVLDCLLLDNKNNSYPRNIQEQMLHLVETFPFHNCAGILVRIVNDYKEDTLPFFKTFYAHVVKGFPIGQALLRARQEDPLSELTYLLFGFPWTSLT